MPFLSHVYLPEMPSQRPIQLKLSHDTPRDCRVRFCIYSRQPFLKQMYISKPLSCLCSCSMEVKGIYVKIEEVGIGTYFSRSKNRGDDDSDIQRESLKSDFLDGKPFIKPLLGL